MLRAVISFVLMSPFLLADTITIAVAANVSYAMEELKTEFSRSNPDTKVVVILGSSGKLTAQIRNGAPYGLLMSADMRYPQDLFDDKIAVSKPLVYAKGSLAYFSVNKRDFSGGIGVLTDEKIYKIAIANPKTAPYGKASLEAMKTAKVYEQLKTKLVFAESVSQTLAYAMTATDIGLVAKSSLYSAKMSQYKENVHWSSVDESLYQPIEQGVVLLKYADKSSTYQLFYDFILSPKAKAIFKKYGYVQ